MSACIFKYQNFFLILDSAIHTVSHICFAHLQWVLAPLSIKQFLIIAAADNAVFLYVLRSQMGGGLASFK